MSDRTFDIFLNFGLEDEEEYEALIEGAKANSDCAPILNPNLKDRLLNEIPEFLGLELPYTSAQNILRLLVKQSAAGGIAPTEYCTPRITYPEALEIARRELEQMHKKENSTGKWGIPVLGDEGSVNSIFSFEFSSETFTERTEEHIPRHLSVRIDKLDGHIVGWEEIEEQTRKYTLLNEGM